MATLSQEAKKSITRLKKPDGMRRGTWADIQALLKELAGHLPDVRPGLQRLADRLDMSLSATHRLVVRAEGLGLISREAIETPGSQWNGHRYTLLFLPTFPPSSLPTSGSKEEPSPTGKEGSSTTSKNGVGFAPSAPGGSGLRGVNRYDGVCSVCSWPVGAWEGFLHGPLPVHRECDSGEPDWPRLKEYLMRKSSDGDPAQWGAGFGDDPEAPLPSYSPPPAKVQARLAKHFEARWNAALALYREWRGVYRGIDLGPAIGYIKTKFLDAGFNEEHVTLMIDEFFTDLLDPQGELMMREGQTAWQLFTGWWGRNPVEDPVPIRRQREKLDALSKAVADHIASITKPEAPPVRRRVVRG